MCSLEDGGSICDEMKVDLYLKELQCMQAELNSLSGEGAKKRLVTIIDDHIKTLAGQLVRDSRKVLAFNEALLEEWTEVLHKMIFIKDGKPPQVKSTYNTGKNQLVSVRTFPSPNPFPHQANKQYLLNIDANTCDLYHVDKPHLSAISLSKLCFPRGYVRKYCSYNFIDAENAILIGGSRESNPNLKSKEIFTLNVISEQVAKLAELPFGVSSHTSVRIKDRIYVIGGNRDMNTVTKSCLSFNYNTREVEKIASLNYPSASHTTISWRDQFIYKFGGVGSCFGEWDLSPYIERYSIVQNEWEVVNPTIKIDQAIFDHYSLLANSLAVACNDCILIFGGFDFKFCGSNKLMQMAINEDQHQITMIGRVQGMQVGGFFQQQPILLNNQLVALQSIDIPKEGLEHKIVYLSSQIRYA